MREGDVGDVGVCCGGSFSPVFAGGVELLEGGVVLADEEESAGGVFGGAELEDGAGAVGVVWPGGEDEVMAAPPEPSPSFSCLR